MAVDDLIEVELMLNRFNRLMGDLIRGEIPRNVFHPWEVEILLDLDNCEVPSRRRQEILRQYQKAVQRQMEAGTGPPMKLSEFLEIRERRREGSSAAAQTVPPGTPERQAEPPVPPVTSE